jgi:hypothetical protein
VTITVQDLFTPAVSGVGTNQAVPPAGSWLAVMLTIANDVQLPTTSWQSGAPELSILSVEAISFSQSDANVSIMAQGGFLDSAASGSVTYALADGTLTTVPVTPDPSNASQNPTGALGWLDLNAQSVYGVTRLAQSYASGPLAIANTTGGTLTYTTGSYRVGNTSTGATYANESPISAPSSLIPGTGGQIAAILVGTAYTTITTTSAHGLSPNQVVYLLLPASSGVTMQALFGAVTSVPSSTQFTIGVGSTGAYTTGGIVYLCTLATMIADAPGIGSNAAPNTVTTAITQTTGVLVSNVVPWAGANWESNTAYVTRTRNSLAAASPNGPSQAYVYFAETAAQLLAAQTPPYVLTNGPVSATETANPATGLVTTVVASSTPASTTLGQAVTPGCAQLAIAGATNANPIVITTAGNHGMISGNSATISGVLGNVAANGGFIVTVLSPTTFSIPVAGSGAYTVGGQVEGGDLGAIDALIQKYVVPDGIAGALTVSALAFPITVIGTVTVPRAYVSIYTLAYQAALQTFLASLDIGGDSPVFTVEYDGIIGALEDAGVLVLNTASYVISIQNLTVNGGVTNVPFPTSQYQSVLASASSITVVGA